MQSGPTFAVRRVNFDVPLVAPDRAYIDVKWTGTIAPTAVPTAMSRCVGSACTSTALAPARSRSGTAEFGNRFDFARGGADALGLTVGAPGRPLLQRRSPGPRSGPGARRNRRICTRPRLGRRMPPASVSLVGR